jgi:tetratricopeptide (TPR) repeat protein
LSGRVLIVLGAQEQKDLGLLYELFETKPVFNLDILIVWPVGQPSPQPPANTGIGFHVWQGSIDRLIAALREAGAPSAGELPQWPVRVRKKVLGLQARDVQRILERFVLLTERDVLPPTSFDFGDLQDFLDGSLKNWSAYGAGLPVQRAYLSKTGLTLSGELKRAIDLLDRAENDLRTFTLELPCEGGSGATTMLRHAAYQAAADGYPVLILRPEQVDVDVEDLGAFATALWDTALANDIIDMPPILIVLDVEHEGILRRSHLPQLIASRGRKAVFFQAVAHDEQKSPEKRGKQLSRLAPLRAQAEEGEVEQCAETFRNIAQRWSLPLPVPSLDQWKAYDAASRWERVSSEGEGASLFWVALRYFLTEEMDLSYAQRARDALGRWVTKRASKIDDPGMRNVVTYVATLSAFRIPCPVWTVLRPISGGTFSSKFMDTLRQIKDIVRWGDYSEELGDYILQFAHPVLAEEYLRQQGLLKGADRVAFLTPLLGALSQGNPGDTWLAESLTTAVVPTYGERRSLPGSDWEWRLELFDKFPPLLRDTNKTILHHWARCLYLSAEGRIIPNLSTSVRRSRLEKAVEKLKRAAELPRAPGRGEHPSHLYNTLGTAYSRLAQFLIEVEQDSGGETAAWEAACHAFEQSINLSDGVNIDALLAFSTRLLSHFQRDKSTPPPQQVMEDVTHALSLLDTAEELLEDYENPDEEWSEQIAYLRAQALKQMSTNASGDFIRTLKNSDGAELGYQIEARLALGDANLERGVRNALRIFDDGEIRGVKYGCRSILLRIAVLRKHPEERFNFARLASLYRQLEVCPGYASRAIDEFRIAVLSYQLDDYAQGADRFRRLRERWRRSGVIPLRVREMLLDPSDPTRPRKTFVRVTRITTEWRAEGYVDELRQTIPLRPRHFDPPPRENEIVPCVIRFELNGPLAVPVRFAERREYRIASSTTGDS